jgi:hypothetical protein
MQTIRVTCGPRAASRRILNCIRRGGEAYRTIQRARMKSRRRSDSTSTARLAFLPLNGVYNGYRTLGFRQAEADMSSHKHDSSGALG